MRGLRTGLSILLAVIAVLATVGSSTQASDAPVDTYFKETGFTVPAVFMKFWQARGGLALYGYPISAMRTEGGYQVQYFERNRFEYHPEHKGTNFEVQLGLLGSLLSQGRQFLPGSLLPDSSDHRYFQATQHALGGVFLRYWLSHGGLDVFGYPISEEIQENGYIVQYFERNRFEYHPENAGTQYEVLLGLLGRDYMALVDSGRMSPDGKAYEQPPDNPVKVYGPAPSYTPPPAGPFLKGPKVGFGIIADMYYKDRTRILNAIQDVGFTWVKQQAQWKDMEGPRGTYVWGELDNIVRDVNARGLNLMVSVVKAPDWATGGQPGFPNDPEDFGHFMQAMAKHYKGQVKAYELWNEENLIGESGDLNPQRYYELLKAGYTGVKAADPDAVVIMGALTPTGVHADGGQAQEDTVYLDTLYRISNGEIRKYFDVLGSHPYGYNNPPETMWPDNPSTAKEFTTHGQFYFRRVEQQQAVMQSFGDSDKQVWLTEWGWCSDFRPDGYNECAQNTLDDQANYTIRAYQYGQQHYPWMGVTFLWNLNFSTFQDWYTGPAHFSVLNGDWTQRPVYTAIKNYIHQFQP